MDKRLKTIVDNFDKMKIGLDDTFNFDCTMCGLCCKDRDDIIFTPKDLFRIAGYLNMSIKDFIEKYCEVYIGGSSRMPIARLLAVESDRRCPFLKNNKCEINSVKPTVCALFPLGRCISFEPLEKMSEITANDIVYINQKPNCGNNRVVHTVREWLEKSNIPIKDEFFVKWNSALAQISMIVHDIEGKVDDDVMQEFYNKIFWLLYLIYDFKEDFFSQFDRNVRFAIEISRRLKERYDG